MPSNEELADTVLELRRLLEAHHTEYTGQIQAHARATAHVQEENASLRKEVELLQSQHSALCKQVVSLQAQVTSLGKLWEPLFLNLPLDVHAYLFDFLGPKDQASLRAATKYFRVVFNHAAQRGYVAVMICEEYVEDVNDFHKDGEDGNPKLHFGPGNQKNLFAPKGADWFTYNMQRSEKDKNATLLVNVAKMLGKGETKLQEYFLRRAQFKAVHLIGTETLEAIDDGCLYEAQNLACFTMSTACPKLRSVGNCWLFGCSALTIVSFRGCTALESVGDYWLSDCSSLHSIAFEGCSALERVGGNWLSKCTALQLPDFSPLVSLTSVDHCWLSECSSLNVASFAGCSALEQVGVYWIHNCPALEETNLESCVSLTSLGSEWLEECPRLRRVVLPADTLLPDDVVEKVRQYLK